eukprot:412989-Heterocapsa_arctica.AAC.1
MEPSSLLFATDASGGKFSADPMLRRIGWAVVAVIPEILQVAGYSIGNIAGAFNTVNRGELLAVATLVEAFGGKGEALTDSSFVSKGIYKMQRGLQSS